MLRNSFVALALAVTTAVVAAGCDRPTAASTAAVDAKAKPIKVEALTVAQQPMPNTVLLAGSLKANQESDLAANASGRVMRTFVERGTYLAKGASIAQLDTRMATLVASESLANLETARAQKSWADQECSRYQQLLKRGAISQAEYDRQTTSCKTAATSTSAAEQREQQARQTLGDATIRAPFPGLVAERYVSVGEYVRPDTKIAHLVDIDPLRLELTIPEQNMGAVKKGQSVTFQVAAFPDQTFTGTVSYIGPAVRSATRDLVFEAVVQNKDKLLRPGLFATARLDLGKQAMPVVPKTALRQDGETMRAFAIVDDAPRAEGGGVPRGAAKHLEERLVQTGIEENGNVAIVSGLKAGERIVAKPTEQHADGQDVE
jgi:RND family efflux transporter MFP subunit